MQEVNRIGEGIHRPHSSKAIHLPSGSPFGYSNPTKEGQEYVEGKAVACDEGNIEKKRCKFTKETETLGHGSFEDEELVNVVQTLVTSRYSSSAPLQSRYLQIHHSFIHGTLVFAFVINVY